MGKTTLFRKILREITGLDQPQIETFAVPKEAVYFHYKQETMQIASYCEEMPGLSNKMRLNDKLKQYGVPILHELSASQEYWVAIDEIGYLETGCQEYCDALIQLMEEKRLFAVIRKQEIPFLESIKAREDVCFIDLDDIYGQIGCVIMASGESKRFGRNKLLEPFGDQTVLEKTLQATELPFAKRTVVTRQEAVVELCKKCGVESRLHQEPNRNDTVRIGLTSLEKVEETIKGCIFSPGDQPLLSKETMEVLVLMIGKQPERIHRLCYQEKMGMPVYFPRKYFEQLKHLPIGKGGKYIIQQNLEDVILVPAKNQWELYDMDTPEDFRILLEKQKELC